MRVRVTEECIACELCVESCPEIFEMGDSIAQVKEDEVPSEYEDVVRNAAERILALTIWLIGKLQWEAITGSCP